MRPLYYKDSLMDFIYISHDGRYGFIVLLNVIPIPGPDLEVKVTDLVLLKGQNFTRV